MHCQRLAKVWSIWLISEFSHYIYLVGVLVMYYGWVSLFWKSKKASSSPQTNLVARFKIYEMIFPATLGWSDDGNGLRSESRAMPNTWAAPSHAIPIVIIAIAIIILIIINTTTIISDDSSPESTPLSNLWCPSQASCKVDKSNPQHGSHWHTIAPDYLMKKVEMMMTW